MVDPVGADAAVDVLASPFITNRIAEVIPLASVANLDGCDEGVSSLAGDVFPEFQAEGAVDVEGVTPCSTAAGFGESLGGKGGGKALSCPRTAESFPIVLWLSPVCSEEATEAALCALTSAVVCSANSDVIDAGLEDIVPGGEAVCPISCNTFDAPSVDSTISLPPAACIVRPISGLVFTDADVVTLAPFEADKLDKREEGPEAGAFWSAVFLERKRNEIKGVASRGCSFLDTTAVYVSGSFHTTCSWSGSGCCLDDDVNSLYPDATEKKDDGPDSAGGSMGEVCDAELARTTDILASSS